MAATINVLAAVDVPGYFEGDVAKHNPFRDEVGGVPYAIDSNGCVKPSEKVGLGVEINEAFITAHPLIEGPCYV
jgi:L-alanine-DL-glutamate epimerase-like enolase superfamily enzyme